MGWWLFVSGVVCSFSGVRECAGRVVGVCEGLVLVGQAVGLSMPGRPFGLMCSPLLLPPYVGVSTQVEMGVGVVCERLEGAAESLRVMAREFEETDERVAQGFDALSAGL